MRCISVPDGAAAQYRIGAADEVIDRQANELAVKVLLAFAGSDQVKVECADELEEVAAVILIDSGEHLVQQDQPG